MLLVNVIKEADEDFQEHAVHITEDFRLGLVLVEFEFVLLVKKLALLEQFRNLQKPVF